MDAGLDWDERRFQREGALLALFGLAAVLVVRPTPTSTWVGTGALLGVCYWTLMYHPALEVVRSKLPGGSAVNAIWSFVVVAVILEFVGTTATVTGGLVLGFVAGVLSAGLVAAARNRVVARLTEE